MTSRRAETGAVRIFRSLLWLYPAEFRDEYGRELSLLFVDRWRETQSWPARLRMWLETIIGVLVEAPKEQIFVMHDDLTYAFRVMRKQPATSALSIAMLALGIGAVTLIFTLANGLLIRPLPYPASDRLAAIDEWSPTNAGEFGSVNIANFADIAAATTSFAELGLYEGAEANIRGDGPAEHVQTAFVSAGALRAVGVAPALGHLFTDAEDAPNGPTVVLLSADVWKRRFGGDREVVGKTLDTGNRRYTIVGVMPEGFRFPAFAELWFPMHADPSKALRTDYHVQAIGRLHAGVSTKQAATELESLLAGVHRANPSADNGWHARAQPFRDVMAGEYRDGVVTLLVAVSLLLLVACANVANLLLVRATARAREMALRIALGASRRRLIRQLVTENLLLGLVGGVLGVALARLGVPALLSLIPIDLPAWMHFSLDGRVLAVALGTALATSLIFGLAPALGASRGRPAESLREGGRGGTSGVAQRRWRNGLVIGEVAFSVMLLIGAGLMIRSFIALRLQPLGYAPADVLTLAVDYPAARYPSGPKAQALVDSVGAGLRSLPGVTSVAFSTQVPLGVERWTRLFSIEGRAVPLQEMSWANHLVVTPEYFRTIGVPLIEGRTFTTEDFAAGSALVVSQTFATRYWPGESALDKRVRFGPPTSKDPWHTIVGVVGDSRVGMLKGTDDPNVYLPYGAYEGGVTPSYVLLRAAGDSHALINAARSRIVGIDRDIALTRVFTLDDLVERAAWRDRFVAYLFGVFAAMALVLAALGLYGVLSYTVALQTREIGIRLLLGAQVTAVRRMMIQRAGSLSAAGLAIGVVGALLLTPLLARQLFNVSPYDRLTIGVTIAVLAIVATFASVAPALRATRVDPVTALKQD